MADLLNVSGLTVRRRAAPGGPPLVDGVSFALAPGESLALLGASGSGKSLTARALLGLLPASLAWEGGIDWEGRRLVDPRGEEWRAVRGRGLGLVLQEPQAALNPVLRVGDQVIEALVVRGGVPAPAAEAEAIALLEAMQVPEPALTARRYPHELSGGMRQRVLLAAALACRPRLLIADEPTTALDTAVQREILALLRRAGEERGMGMIFITHDRDLVPLLADRYAEMDGGRLGPVQPVAALAPVAVPTAPAQPAAAAPSLVARGLRVRYPGTARDAVAGVDMDLVPGRVVGLLGRSGCGKTSLARALSGHVAPTGGSLEPRPRSRADRRRVQLLFQDPGGSLDPRQRVGEALREAAGPVGRDAGELLAEVGLPLGIATRWPHELSGGQRQRVALARCLAAEPAVLVADEPTSALDHESAARVLGLLERVGAERGLALLLVSHDVRVLARSCHEIHVMVAGVVVEVFGGGAGAGARHPYTRDLMRVSPAALRRDPSAWRPDRDLTRPGFADDGPGCPLFGGCRLQKAICGKGLPPLKTLGDGGRLRCPEAETTDASHFIDT